ncbi:MAG: hypothetical protein ACI906_000219 [Candidatus Latescibacterota bacterium]
MLTDKEIASFKELGFVVLPDLIDPEHIEDWNVQFWNHIAADPGNSSTWPDNYVIDRFATDPLFGHLPPMQEVVQQLGGDQFAGGGGSMLVQWPHRDGHWAMPEQGHIDGYGPNGWSGGFMLGATAYLEDVEDEGGAFIYWPQSHLTTHQYFLENPSHIDGSFTERDDWKERSWGLFSDPSPQEPEQFTAQAGDVILWHCNLCHTGSSNILQRPRLGLFSRWHHVDRENMRYEVPEDMWKYWAI